MRSIVLPCLASYPVFYMLRLDLIRLITLEQAMQSQNIPIKKANAPPPYERDMRIMAIPTEAYIRSAKIGFKIPPFLSQKLICRAWNEGHNH
jgi:hypothetical protein